MMSPGDVLLLGTALLALLFLIGGATPLFRFPVKHRSRRTRKPVPHPKPRRPGLTELLREWLQVQSARRRVGGRRHKRSALHRPTKQATGVPQTLPVPKSDDEVAAQPVPVLAMASAPDVERPPVPPRKSTRHTTAARRPHLRLHRLGGAVPALISYLLCSVLTGLFVAVIVGTLVLEREEKASIESRPQDASLTQQAMALAAKGDHKGAWNLYYQALQSNPEDVSLWYALGVTLSHLNLQKETAEVFRHVVRKGPPNSEEVGFARRWLAAAGLLAAPVKFAVPSYPALDDRRGESTVKGTVTWGAPDSDRPSARIQLMLAGLNGAGQGKRFYARAALGESYRFERLPAGLYRLIGAAGGQQVWDLTLSVEYGKEVVLDLGKDNSITPTVALFQ